MLQKNRIHQVTDNLQDTVLQNGYWVRGKQLLTVKNQLVMKCYMMPQAGSCKHGNEPSGSIKGRKFLD
jgi:hypothetical protein